MIIIIKKTLLLHNKIQIMKPVLQILLILFVNTLFPNFSFSQTFDNIPNDTVKMTGIMEDNETISIQQLNISTDTISLKWKKVSEVIPNGWDASVCDNKICYTSLVDSGIMNPVIPSDTGFLLLHLTSHINYGMAIIRYAVWDVANPTIRDTLTYILKVENTVKISESETKNKFIFFPNPANDKIEIASSFQTNYSYILTDISGKIIKTENSTTNNTHISIGDLPQDVYFITIKLNNNLFTHKFIKH